MRGDWWLCAVAGGLLGSGCFVLRAPEPMGPDLVDASSRPARHGEFWAGGGGGFGHDAFVQPLLRKFAGGGGADLALGKGVSLVFAGQLGSLSGSPVGRNRIGLRFRGFDHFYAGVGFSPMFAYTLTAPFLAGDIEVGGSATLGPVLISGGVKIAFSNYAYPVSIVDPFLYAMPTVGIVIRPESDAPIGPFVQVGGHAGGSLRTRGWWSWDVRVWAGIHGRLGAPPRPRDPADRRSLE